MTNLEKKATKAHRNVEQIRIHTRAVQINMLVLGRLFHENHVFEYYKALGYETWKEFLAQPDICYKESTVRSLVGIYKKYILELEIDEDRLMKIGHLKLRIISTVVHEAPDEWLDKAEHLSASDLIYEVKALPPKPAKKEMITVIEPISPEAYVELVRKSPCCVCGDTKNVVAHHHPQKRRPTDADWKVIPLCRMCHDEYHANESVYRHDWDKHFYDFLYKIIVKRVKNVM